MVRVHGFLRDGFRKSPKFRVIANEGRSETGRIETGVLLGFRVNREPQGHFSTRIARPNFLPKKFIYPRG